MVNFSVLLIIEHYKFFGLRYFFVFDNFKLLLFRKQLFEHICAWSPLRIEILMLRGIFLRFPRSVNLLILGESSIIGKISQSNFVSIFIVLFYCWLFSYLINFRGKGASLLLTHQIVPSLVTLKIEKIVISHG